MKSNATMTREDSGATVTIEKLTLHRGAAGQVSAVATVRHDWHTSAAGGSPNAGDSDVTRWECVGSTFGGPVVAMVAGGTQMWVRDPERFGTFATDPREWMRRYVLNDCEWNRAALT